MTKNCAVFGTTGLFGLKDRLRPTECFMSRDEVENFEYFKRYLGFYYFGPDYFGIATGDFWPK